jgi:hypothetical protein
MFGVKLTYNFNKMKNLKKLNGAKVLSKSEQRSINGGRFPSCYGVSCNTGYHCIMDNGGGICVPDLPEMLA